MVRARVLEFLLFATLSLIAHAETVLFSNPVALNGGLSSEPAQIVANHFSISGGGSISQVSWYGNAWFGKPFGPFSVTFYEDTGHGPGAVLATNPVTPAIVDTGQKNVFFGGGQPCPNCPPEPVLDVYEFTAAIPIFNAASGVSYFFSVESTGETSFAGNFVWADGSAPGSTTWGSFDGGASWVNGFNGAAFAAASAFTLLGNVPSPPVPPGGTQGLWWASPAGSESGWGINFAHQGDTIFASWFSYDATGKGVWLVMTASKTGPGTYSGTLYTTKGPPFDAVPFNPAQVAPTAVGNGTLSFSDANNGTFSYTVNGVSQNKALTHQVFGTLPACAAATGSLAAATNYTDLWWASPAGSESGWGINFTQQGDTIFATWFTYDLDGTPMWLVVTAAKSAPGVYTGTLYRTTGPPFNSVPFNPANVVATAVGTATFTFADGNDATFAYTVNGISQQKAITRELFSGAGTVCQ